MANLGSKSTSELIFEVADDVRQLFRKELELARVEVTESVKGILKGSGIIALAVLGVLPGLLFLLIAAALALPGGPALGFAIVGVVLVVLPAAAIPFGLRKLRKASKPQKTVESLKENVEWARERLTR